MTAIPASFGDVTGEYLALRDGCGFLTGAHEVVWADGPDAVPFLDGLLSQSIEPMELGTGAHSLLLGPQGKLRATLWVLRDAERVGMLCDAGRGDVVLGDLQRFLLRVEVSLSLDQRPVLEAIGPGSGDVLSAAGLPVPPWRGWLSAAVGAHLGEFRGAAKRRIGTLLMERAR